MSLSLNFNSSYKHSCTINLNVKMGVRNRKIETNEMKSDKGYRICSISGNNKGKC